MGETTHYLSSVPERIFCKVAIKGFGFDKRQKETRGNVVFQSVFKVHLLNRQRLGVDVEATEDVIDWVICGKSSWVKPR